MAAARLMAVVVLPTPPFWLATVRMAVIECPARVRGGSRASLGRWAANPPAWLSVPFRLPGPKPFGCQQSNRVRMATQAKNVQSINNKSATGLRSLRLALGSPQFHAVRHRRPRLDAEEHAPGDGHRERFHLAAFSRNEFVPVEATLLILRSEAFRTGLV